ncbi:MAG: phosphotransferase [Deltaproteobacteria bacterium]|nr:phosphotransferase [Deltaproteobacteria bacterium]
MPVQFWIGLIEDLWTASFGRAIFLCMDDLQQQAHALLKKSSLFSNATLDRVDLLAGDMSTRRYARLYLSDAKVSTVILMLLNQGKGPVRGGRQDLTQDDTFVQLTNFLSGNGIAVPRLYLDARKEGALLVEDVGDMPLWHFAFRELRDEHRKVEDLLGADAVEKLYRQCIDITKTLQSIPEDPKCIAFQRWVEFEQYRREIAEFAEYYAKPKGIKPAALKLLENAYDAICESICSHPRKLSHFDYMSHNLFVTPEGGIRVLDFQDMCLVSPVRDIVSLINDRDTDSALGKSRHARLLEYFMKELAVDAAFPQRYNEYMLHWDFRVSGRFVLLAEQRGIARYGKWIPGTLRRLGRTLVRAHRDIHGLSDVLDMLVKLSPEIREGSEDPWDLPLLPRAAK